MRQLPDCAHCGTPLYQKVTHLGGVEYSAHVVESRGKEHDVYRCRDILALEVKRLQAAEAERRAADAGFVDDGLTDG